MLEESGSSPEQQEPKTFDEAYVKELRAEAKKNRLALRESEKLVEDLTNKLKEFEEKEKTELERVAKKLADSEAMIDKLKRELFESNLRNTIINEAQKYNVIDAETVYKLIDTSEIDLSDSKSVKKAIENLLREKPFLAAKYNPPTPGIGGPPIQSQKSGKEKFAEIISRRSHW